MRLGVLSFLSNQDLKLTDFPFSRPGYGKKVAVVGIGSAGCKIAHQLSKESRLLEHFVYISCDDSDIATVSKGERILFDATRLGKESPSVVRGLAGNSLHEIKRNLSDSEIVFVISGLGGTVGSGVAPLVVKHARESKKITVAILVMPSSHDKSKHFFAGCALNQIRSMASGVIIIDSDEMQTDVPLIDAHAEVNQRISLALNKLLGSAEENEYSIGLNNLISFVRSKSYSVLCVSESPVQRGYKHAVMNAAEHFHSIVDETQASKSLVHLCADESITMNELVISIGELSGVLGDGTMKIEYGLSANSFTSNTTAIIMATGFSGTKFDHYDPVNLGLGARSFNLDLEMDGSICLESLLPDAERE